MFVGLESRTDELIVVQEPDALFLHVYSWSLAVAKVTDVVITIVFGGNARHVTAGVDGQSWRAQTLVPPPDLIREILCKTHKAVENQAASIDLTVDTNGVIQRTESYVLPAEGCPAVVSAAPDAMFTLPFGESGDLDRDVAVALSTHDDRHRLAIDLIRSIVSKVPEDLPAAQPSAGKVEAGERKADEAAAGKVTTTKATAGESRAGKATAETKTAGKAAPEKATRKTKRAGKKSKR